jgi:mucin-19
MLRRVFVLGGVGLAVFAVLFASSPTAKAYTITATTDNYATTTGGGGFAGPEFCAADSVIYQMGATGDNTNGALTRPVAGCVNLNSAASAHNAVTTSIAPTTWGGAGNTALTPVRCTTGQAVVGMVVHKQANGYVSGWQLMCGTLPAGGSRTTDSVTFGWPNAGTASPSQRETIQCPTGMVAVGMVAWVGSIMDRIGFRCGTITGANQADVTITSSSSITFGSTLALTATGGTTGGTLSFAASGACSLSGSTLTATGNAGATCSVTATRAGNTNYAAKASATQTVTIQRAANTISFTNPGTKTWSATPFNVTVSATSGITPSVTSTTTSVCSVSGIAVTMLSSGTCSLTASQGETTNHVAAVAAVQSFTINPTGRSAFTGNSATISGTTTGTKYVVERFTTTGASTWSVPQGVTSIDYLVVAGGAGGGSRHAGGGGAGGLRSSVTSTGGGASPESAMTVTPGGSLTVTVGAGGASWTNGSDSVLGNVTAIGGGTQSTAGGSGGGTNCCAAAGGTGTANQGFNGGRGTGNGSDANWLWAGGGGGGAGAAGSNAGSSGGNAFGGAGGAGVTNSITGVAACYAGGGGGGYSGQATNAGTIEGGKCGSTMVGGTSPRGANATAGAINTGSGGGGGGFDGASFNYAGGAGGSGIVVVRYVLPAVTTPNLLGADDTGVNTDNITSTRTLRSRATHQ